MLCTAHKGTSFYFIGSPSIAWWQAVYTHEGIAPSPLLPVGLMQTPTDWGRYVVLRRIVTFRHA